MDEVGVLAANALTDGRLASLAAALAAEAMAEPSTFGVGAKPPLAGGGGDQVDTLGNPYWRVLRNVPTEAGDGRDEPTTTWLFATTPVRNRVRAAGLDRGSLCRRYSWSIPTPGDIVWLDKVAGSRGVVELGAGGGYWAALMRAAGIDTLAYDPHPASNCNGYAKRTYTTVEPGDDSVARDHTERALFICWPSHNNPWAARALTQYRGDMLLYAGQEADGCTGDDKFFELLGRDWEQVEESAEHLTYHGVPCRLTAWRR